MFKKKRCKKCGEKISDKYDYCPYCGNSNKDYDDANWGMLGKNDFEDPFRNSFGEIKLPAGLGMIFNSLMRNLEEEFKNIDRQIGREIKNPEIPKDNIRKSGVSISISTSGNKPPEIRVNQFGGNPKLKQIEKQVKQTKEIPSKILSEESIRKFSKLPREEPSTNIRRLSNKVVYEIDMPGVKSIKDISIIKLENSIEIKAIAKDKAYFKLIPINLPIIDYKISKGKLVLELEAKG